MCCRRGADQIAHGISGELSAGRRNRLIENRQRVAHGAVAGFGQQSQSIVIGFDLFSPDQIAQLADDVVELHRAKTEVLAARADGLRNVLRLRGRHHEDDVIRRLFQSLEQGIEGRIGDLVRFVENVNLEAVARRTITGGFAQFADFVDPAVGGGVDFDHVNRVARANLGAGFTNAARLRDGLVRRTAIQRRSQNARHGCFSDAAMSAENVAVGSASLFDGVLQGTGDVLLSDHLGEFLRTVFARQDGVAHEPEDMIIRDARRRHGRGGFS